MTEAEVPAVNEARHINPGLRLPLRNRSKTLDWRSANFTAIRGTDQAALDRARQASLASKAAWITKFGPGSGHLGSYDPAGAGSPWYSIGPRNVNGRVKSLAVHPANPNILYAGSASGGVWKSTNGGQSWDPIWDMQESLAVGAIAIAASSPTILYAGTGEWTPGWGPGYAGVGMYVSTDSGASWVLKTAVHCRAVGKLVVDPTDPQRVWLSGDAGLERTDDGGNTSTVLRTDTVTDIVLSPTDSQTIYAAVRYSGFYVSHDRGSTWSALPGAPTGTSVEWPQIVIGRSGPHGDKFILIKTGPTMQTSIDGGTTFSAVSGSHTDFYAGWCDVAACAPDEENTLFWGGVGLYRTTDNGASWSSLPVHADQHVATCAPSSPNTWYFANDGGIYRSDDRGVTVNKVSNGLVITQFYNINCWKTLGNVVGGGAQDNGSNYTMGGLTWQPVYGGDGGWFVIDPTDPRTIYAESQYANIVKSTDGGGTWAGKTSGITGTSPWEGVLTMDPNNHLNLYYGTSVVLRNADGLGTAWVTSSQSLAGEVSAIAVAPSSSSRVYAAGGGHVYRSDDSGTTSPWADKSTGLPLRPVTSIYVDPGNADHLVISVGGLSGAPSAQAVYQSTDGGTSWSNRSGDLPQVSANGVVIDPSDANTLYVATDSGVYRTTNGGTNWVPFDNGIPNVVVSGLVLDRDHHRLYVSTMGRGAYKMDITPAVNKPAVDLYLRDDDLDTGEFLPSPSNLPDPLLPAPQHAYWWMSPDIKVNHAPFYVPSGLFDGVDFDATLVHEDPYRGAVNRFYLQVHNRGYKATNNVRVRAFVADASAGLPALPNTLSPPDFNLTSTAHWQPVGPAQTIPLLEPNTPVIVTWDYNIPVTAATHTCCLAVVSSPDDPFNSAATDIGTLVTDSKQAALKNLHIVNPSQAPQSLMMALDFTGSLAAKGAMDISIIPSELNASTIHLLLPKLGTLADSSLQNVKRVEISPADVIGTWALPFPKTPVLTETAMGRGAILPNVGTAIHSQVAFPAPAVRTVLPGTAAVAPPEQLLSSQNLLANRLDLMDRSVAWQFDSTKPGQLKAVPVGAGATVSGVLVVDLKPDPDRHVPPRVTVIQIQGGKVVGGSTFQFGQDSPVSADRLGTD